MTWTPGSQAGNRMDPAAADRAAALIAQIRLQRRHGLAAYHLPFLAAAERLVGLRGRRVLEVGGRVPFEIVCGELGAALWIAIDALEHWHAVVPVGHAPAAGEPHLPLTGISDTAQLGRYAVLSGTIHDLPPALHGRFDVAFSMAAFEHVHDLPTALDHIFEALVPGGQLFTLFGPVWSAHDGHHLPTLRDGSGREITSRDAMIPPWGHLLIGPTALAERLAAHTDAETVATIVHYIYRSRHINRLFVEDYETIFARSRLTIEVFRPVFPYRGDTVASGAAARRLAELYPGRRDFNHGGILAVLRRP